jgi:Asp/Glu/hydantoin racemase
MQTMNLKTLGLIHTSATLVPIFAELCKTSLPNVDVFNIADDSLIKEVIAHNRLTASVSRRVVGHVAAAEAAGADVVLVTCSSIGTAVELAGQVTDIPVIRVDQAMADAAVRAGKRIGVAATLPTTLQPTADLVRRRARLANVEVELVERLCEGAFDALMSGDSATHDQHVLEALEHLASEVDVLVLAQASMARVAGQMPDSGDRPPILSSPALAIKAIANEY